MMPRFNLGLLAPQPGWGQTTASFPNAELGGMQMPTGGLFAAPQPYQNQFRFQQYGNINPSDIMAQLGLGQGRVNLGKKNKNNVSSMIGPFWNTGSAAKNPGTDPYEFGY